MKSKQDTSHLARRKMPLTLKLIVVWMIYMIIHTALKLLDLSRIERNELIMSRTAALINYAMDGIILIAFIVITLLFIMRTRNAWKYFMYLIGFLIVGVLISLAYLPKMVALFPANSREFILLFTILSCVGIMVFYGLLLYLVYKKRSYFA